MFIQYVNNKHNDNSLIELNQKLIDMPNRGYDKLKLML
jgi:hypothetical protein